VTRELSAKGKRRGGVSAKRLSLFVCAGIGVRGQLHEELKELCGMLIRVVDAHVDDFLSLRRLLMRGPSFNQTVAEILDASH